MDVYSALIFVPGNNMDVYSVLLCVPGNTVDYFGIGFAANEAIPLWYLSMLPDSIYPHNE